MIEEIYLVTSLVVCTAVGMFTFFLGVGAAFYWMWRGLRKMNW